MKDENSAWNTGRMMMAVTKELHGKLSSTLKRWRQVEPINCDWHLQVQMSPNYRFGITPNFFTYFPRLPWIKFVEWFHFLFHVSSHELSGLEFIKVRVNDQEQNPPLFTTGVIGKDNAIARHGIHGLYWFYTIDVSSLLLKYGENTIYLTQTIATDPLALFHGIMYDYIRLETPNPFLPIKKIFN